MKRYLLILLAAIAVYVVAFSISVYAQTGTGWFVVSDDLWVKDDVRVDSDMTVAGDLTLSDDLAVTDDLGVGGFVDLTAATSITVTNGAAFTPTGTYQPITSAGTVTPTITVLDSGKLVRLINTSATSIVIVDTSTTKLSGDITLGQYDSLLLMSDGTNWIQMATSNN